MTVHSLSPSAPWLSAGSGQTAVAYLRCHGSVTDWMRRHACHRVNAGYVTGINAVAAHKVQQQCGYAKQAGSHPAQPCNIRLSRVCGCRPAWMMCMHQHVGPPALAVSNRPSGMMSLGIPTGDDFNVGTVAATAAAPMSTLIAAASPRHGCQAPPTVVSPPDRLCRPAQCVHCADCALHCKHESYSCALRWRRDACTSPVDSRCGWRW